MNYYCDVYSLVEGVATHQIAKLENKTEEDRLDQIIYNESFKSNRVAISIVTKKSEDKFYITKATVVLPPVLSSLDKAKTLELIDNLLMRDILNMARLFVLNFKSSKDNYDIEYHKFKKDEYSFLKPVVETYFNEKTGRLTEEEETTLKNYRTFNLENIVFKEHTKKPFSNNLGTIIITKDDNYYEMAETQAYHEKSAALTLAKHYQDNAYLKYDINKIISLGDIVVVLSALQVLVYRPPIITEFQTKMLERLQERLREYGVKYQTEVITGAFIYTGENILGVMEFLEDKRSTKSLTTDEVNNIIKETNELYYAPVSESNGVTR